MFQPSLLASAEPPSLDLGFGGLERLWLDDRCWVDLQRAWVSGQDALFEELMRTREWRQRARWMYERKVLEPRLTAMWTAESGAPLEPAFVEQMRRALCGRYGVEFDSVGFNLYRDGQDSVAWHGDRIRREIAEPIVALVSLGAPRRLLMRPKGGGKSRPFVFGPGDLMVTGGRTQRQWEHSIPKVANARPRMSLAFRHGMDPRAYGTPELSAGT